MDPQTDPLIYPDGTPTDLLGRILRAFASVEFLEVGPDGRIVDANASLAARLGIAPGDLSDCEVARILTEADASTVAAWVEGDPLPTDPHLLNFVSDDDGPFTLRCLVERRGDRLILVGETDARENRATAEQLLRLNNEFATLTRELSRRGRELERAKAELTAALDELKASYWHLQKIQEVIPVCMNCGKVKADGSRWESVIDYLRASDILVSHGFCPTCLDTALHTQGADREP